MEVKVIEHKGIAIEVNNHNNFVYVYRRPFNSLRSAKLWITKVEKQFKKSQTPLSEIVMRLASGPCLK